MNGRKKFFYPLLLIVITSLNVSSMKNGIFYDYYYQRTELQSSIYCLVWFEMCVDPYSIPSLRIL